MERSDHDHVDIQNTPMILPIAECLGPRNANSPEESEVQGYNILEKVGKEPQKIQMEMLGPTT